MGKKNPNDHPYSWGSSFVDRHPVMANFVIIIIIAMLGIYAAYLATALFTKHGRSQTVPAVVNMTYTEAISRLHERGLKVDIRDSIYRDDVKPGYVIEQFPRPNSIVKPGRKIFLYINAVHPKEILLDDDNHPNEYALKGISERLAKAKLEELGFKKVRVVTVVGSDADRVVKVMANGRPVRKMQKIPVNSSIVIEISDGMLTHLTDSLQNLELLNIHREENASTDYSDYQETQTVTPEPSAPAESSSEEENSMYY